MITTSCPIAATGSLPVCFKVILKSVHEAGTTIDEMLYCMASVPSNSVEQFVTWAVGLPFAATFVSAAAAAGVVGACAGGIACIESCGVAAVGAVAGDAGAASGVVVGDLSLHADKANTQAAASTPSLILIIMSTPWRKRHHPAARLWAT
ncbi:hypothetical protein GCM10009126_18000 [Rhodanobacter caeni]|uniref:Uncharacterized protein n=1 Tax=Rhodanobacter caeni TaxID=657654 RepID=A0ABP3E819_9GAMM